tara:strand:+ start:918 stop:1133 length:216 start_codon:yes stop_codon:yes gene_type:complete
LKISDIFRKKNKQKDKNAIFLNNKQNIWFSSNQIQNHTMFFGTTAKGKTTDWEAIRKKEHIDSITKKLNDF